MTEVVFIFDGEDGKRREVRSELFKDAAAAAEHLLLCGGAACYPLPPKNSVEHPRMAAWKDFAGKSIREGDTIQHPDGSQGVVVFVADGDGDWNKWRVRYDDMPKHITLALPHQISDRGMAAVKS